MFTLVILYTLMVGEKEMHGYYAKDHTTKEGCEAHMEKLPKWEGVTAVVCVSQEKRDALYPHR